MGGGCCLLRAGGRGLGACSRPRLPATALPLTGSSLCPPRAAGAPGGGAPGGGAALADLSEDAPRLLLLFLADRRRSGHSAAASARTFLLCQAFAEEVTNLQRADAAPEALVAKLVEARGGRRGGLGAAWVRREWEPCSPLAPAPARACALQYRQRSDELEALQADVELEAAGAQRLVRYLVQARAGGAAGGLHACRMPAAAAACCYCSCCSPSVSAAPA